MARLAVSNRFWARTKYLAI